MKRNDDTMQMIVSTILSCSILLFSPAMMYGQDFQVSSSPNPVGSGARAIGMGGAFIAVADDATAASWNPGGLTQLQKPEFSIVGAYVYRKEDNFIASHPEAGNSSSVGEENLNYMSFTYPFIIGKYNTVAALTYQHLYDYMRDWTFSYSIEDYLPVYNYEIEGDGNLYALGLSYCMDISKTFSLGITLNYWGDFIFKNEWERLYTQKLNDTVIMKEKDEFAFEGWNANIGFLWEIWRNDKENKLNFGFVIKTPFTADIDHNYLIDGELDSDLEYTKMRMPLSYGMGISYSFSDTFILSADIFRTHWEDYEMEDKNGNKYSPISNNPIHESDIDPTVSIRAGLEYLILWKDKFIIPIRGGLFYDPAPEEKSPDDYYGFSLGTGFGTNSYAFDIAYQFRYGSDVSHSKMSPDKFSQDIEEHLFYTSLIIYF